MTRADNTPFLAQAAAARHQEALSKASEAVERLDRSGQPVTFSAVAAAAGVSRAWLYRNPAIRDCAEDGGRSAGDQTRAPRTGRQLGPACGIVVRRTSRD
jgi:hypothetical protein